jgi:hypothetical protein
MVCRYAAGRRFRKACEDGNLEGIQAVVNNTPQRAALLSQCNLRSHLHLTSLLPASVCGEYCRYLYQRSDVPK